MPEALPNLAGIATQGLVETIGTGKYSAAYINWARTLNLLHEHAPGWCVETVPTASGELVHKAPGAGGFLLIRFRHIDGTVTPEVPQSIMDNRNAPIAFDKITARDVTDTHRRGACLAAAMTFGLAHELWAKMPLESGFAEEDGQEEGPGAAASVVTQAVSKGSASAPARATASPATVTKDQFLEAAIEKGLTTFAAEELAKKVAKNYATGLLRLAEKDEAWVSEYNAANAPKPSDDAKQW